MAENKLTKIDQDWSNLKAVIDATSKKNPREEDLKTLREMMREDSNIWQTYGDWAEQSELIILKEYFESNGFLKETVQEKLKEMRNELGWKDASLLEKLLIRQVCLTWLRLYFVERQHHQYTSGSHSLTSGIYWDKRLNEAQKRHFRAIESLAKVRKITAQSAKLEAEADKAKAAKNFNPFSVLEAMTKT